MGFLWKQRKFPRWRKTWGLENQTGVKNRAKQKISWMISHSGAPPIAMVALFRSLSFWWHWPRWLAGVCVPLSDRYRIIIWSLSDYPLSNTSPMRSHVVKMSTSLTWHHSLRVDFFQYNTWGDEKNLYRFQWRVVLGEKGMKIEQAMYILEIQDWQPS